jgi:hypothetical protein
VQALAVDRNDFDPDRPAIDTRLAQTFSERIDVGRRFRGPLMEESDHRGGLLRAPAKWYRGSNSAEQADELAPLQQIELHSVLPIKAQGRMPNWRRSVSGQI